MEALRVSLDERVRIVVQKDARLKTYPSWSGKNSREKKTCVELEVSKKTKEPELTAETAAELSKGLILKVRVFILQG